MSDFSSNCIDDFASDMLATPQPPPATTTTQLLAPSSGGGYVYIDSARGTKAMLNGGDEIFQTAHFSPNNNVLIDQSPPLSSTSTSPFITDPNFSIGSSGSCSNSNVIKTHLDQVILDGFEEETVKEKDEGRTSDGLVNCGGSEDRDQMEDIADFLTGAPEVQSSTSLHSFDESKLPTSLIDYNNGSLSRFPNTTGSCSSSVGSSTSNLNNNNNNYNNNNNNINKTNATNNNVNKTAKSGGGGAKKKVHSGVGRGRPRKALVTMYHSQISGDKNTIKIRIKKSNLSAQVQLPANKKKTGRRKKAKPTSDTDASDYESRGKKSRIIQNEVNVVQDEVVVEPDEQSVWGECIPENVLYKIFEKVCAYDGCLPTLVRLNRVCKLWYRVASTPTLWNKIDLNYVKEMFRTDYQLEWLIKRRLTHCQDLSLGEWKLREIQKAIESLCENCHNLQGVNFSGCKGINADHLKYLTTECKTLERLDLSSVNSTSAINSLPLVALGQTMSNRLTHLVLAHNKIPGFTQIIASIATNCSNLQLLDISNIRTFSHNSAMLHVEKLQIGCPKLRVLRITNSQIWLAPASLSDQVSSRGFPCLEELSLAGLDSNLEHATTLTTSRSVDDEGIERILKSSTKLRLLDVRGCIRLTDSGLVKVPAWDLEHLFLSACSITRAQHSGLELIVQKWCHSLLEVDLAWSTATDSLDAAVVALAEKGPDSKLRNLNLCGSSVSLEPVKAILKNCRHLHSINLQSCRALPRGMKRLYTGADVVELKQSLQPISEKKSDGTIISQSESLEQQHWPSVQTTFD